MIICAYTQANKVLGQACAGKWYCTYQETRGRFSVSRYMHPTGWKKYCHYWDTKQEAVKAFKLHGQNGVPINASELAGLKEQEEWAREQADE